VQVRGEEWLVARVDAYDCCSIVTLDGGASRRRLRIIEPFDRPRVRRSKPRRAHRRVVFRTALTAIVRARPAIGLWTAAEAAIDLLPYQLEPALAVLRGATRVLLADGVGLGKTIEAGLILSELRARGWAERALVLCPAGLRTLWAGELQQRFNIACAVFDQAGIAETAASLPPGVNPWTGHGAVIASIDLAKRHEMRAALCEAPFDVLITDEAHHLTPGTDRGELVRRIASRTPWCIFLSATPHSGDDAAFQYLAHLGSHGEPLTIFRRAPHHAGRRGGRRERVVRVRPAEREAAILEAVDAYTRAIWRDRGAHETAVRLVAITIARRAASSPLALSRTLLRRLSLLSTPPPPAQPPLPWEEHDAADDEMPAEVLGRAGLANAVAERDMIVRLLTLIDRTESAKFNWLIRFLTRAGEPAIVFTEYRDTLEALLAALPPTMPVASISGAHAPSLRQSAVDAFNGGGADVLVATDTAGEGLNLQRRCRLVVDLELPWNPMRLEQRLGRVDRFGQARRVHAIRLIHPRSIEERVLDCIRRRRTISESEVARWVFQSAAGLGQDAWSPQSASVPAAAAEVERVARQRTVARSPRTGAVAHGTDDSARFVAVHCLTYANALGNVTAEYVAAHAVDREAADRVDIALLDRVREHCALIDQQLQPLRTAVVDRLSRIRRHIADTAQPTVQRSLFDDRADTAARHVHDVSARFDAALARRHSVLTSPATPEGAIATLAAAWPHRQP
jgi:superfamily II DNA or RNA helicase